MEGKKGREPTGTPMGPSILASGVPTSKMALGHSSTIAATCTKGSGLPGRSMAVGCSHSKLVIGSKGNGATTKSMVREHSSTCLVPATRANGRTIWPMGLEKCSTATETCTKVCSRTGRKHQTGSANHLINIRCTRIMMAPAIREVGSVTREVAKAS